MVGTLTSFEVLCLVVITLELGMLFYYLLDSVLHLLDLFMRQFRQAELQVLLEFAFNKVSLALRVHTEVAIHDFVSCQLQEHQSALVPIALFAR